MLHIINLEDFERRTVDHIIEVYKIPLEFILGPDESTAIDSDYFYDREADENLYLEDGLYCILEKINSDNRKLFCEKLDEGEQIALLRIMAELGVTNETTWKNKDLRLWMPQWQKRIVLPLKSLGRNGEKYNIIAEKYRSALDHDEIDIYIEDQNGVVVQDLVQVEPTVTAYKTETTTHFDKSITVKLYEDEYDEDYTRSAIIKVYDDGEETTNY